MFLEGKMAPFLVQIAAPALLALHITHILRLIFHRDLTKFLDSLNIRQIHIIPVHGIIAS